MREFHKFIWCWCHEQLNHGHFFSGVMHPWYLRPLCLQPQGAPQSDEWIPNAWTHQQVEPQDNWFLNGSNIQLNVGFFKNKRSVWQIESEFFPMTIHRHLITCTVHISHFKMYLPSFGNWKHFSFFIYIYISYIYSVFHHCETPPFSQQIEIPELGFRQPRPRAPGCVPHPKIRP